MRVHGYGWHVCLCGDHGIVTLCVCVGDSFLGSSVSPAITPTKKIPGADEQQSSHLLTRQKANLEDEKSECNMCRRLWTFEDMPNVRHDLNLISLQF